MNTSNGVAAPPISEGSGHEFRFVLDWPKASAEDGAAISAFWRAEGALTDESQIGQRLGQVLMHVCTADGSVAGVCTAVALTHPRLGQPVYYWRTFIGRGFRTSQLVMALLKRSCRHLEDYARSTDFPCIGVLLELENERFRDRGRMAVWWNPRFVYIGRSERGLDVRVMYFRGARLKAQPK